MPPPIFAHLGHWYVSLPVFIGPALLLVIALKVQAWRERRQVSHRSGRRSHITVTRDCATTTIAVSGPLSYPAVLEMEVELGFKGELTRELVLDLRRCTTADTESVRCLCDALARSPAREYVVSALIRAEPSMRALTDALAAEGVRTLEAPAADRH
jgi:hypothetical protein